MIGWNVRSSEWIPCAVPWSQTAAVTPLRPVSHTPSLSPQLSLKTQTDSSTGARFHFVQCLTLHLSRPNYHCKHKQIHQLEHVFTSSSVSHSISLAPTITENTNRFINWSAFSLHPVSHTPSLSPQLSLKTQTDSSTGARFHFIQCLTLHLSHPNYH